MEAFPYTVPKFLRAFSPPVVLSKLMPPTAAKLLADVLAPRVSDPAPVSTTIRTCVAVSFHQKRYLGLADVLKKSFKRTHEKYQDKFTEDELSAMNYAQAGNSYCERAS